MAGNGAEEGRERTAGSAGPEDVKGTRERTDEPAVSGSTGDRLESAPADRAAAARVPRRYREMKNPVGHTLAAIEEGYQLFNRHCAACHGAAGEGNGPRAQDLGESMPSLTDRLATGRVSDAYLMWRIMEGGRSLKSENHSFQGRITTREAWQIIAYMRADFPAIGLSSASEQSRQARTPGENDVRTR